MGWPSIIWLYNARMASVAAFSVLNRTKALPLQAPLESSFINLMDAISPNGENSSRSRSSVNEDGKPAT